MGKLVMAKLLPITDSLLPVFICIKLFVSWYQGMLN